MFALGLTMDDLQPPASARAACKLAVDAEAATGEAGGLPARTPSFVGPPTAPPPPPRSPSSNNSDASLLLRLIESQPDLATQILRICDARSLARLLCSSKRARRQSLLWLLLLQAFWPSSCSLVEQALSAAQSEGEMCDRLRAIYVSRAEASAPCVPIPKVRPARHSPCVLAHLVPLIVANPVLSPLCGARLRAAEMDTGRLHISSGHHDQATESAGSRRPQHRHPGQ